MRRVTVTSVCLWILFVGIVQVSNSSVAETYIVDDDGGSWADYTVIQDAVDNTSENDTVLVYSGNYTENVRIEHRLNIEGNGSSFVAVFGGHQEFTRAFFCNAENITIAGLSISGLRGVYSPYNNTVIRDCSFFDSNVGIYFRTGSKYDWIFRQRIINCSFVNTSLSIGLINTVNCQIINCTTDSGIWIGPETSSVSEVGFFNTHTIRNCTVSGKEILYLVNTTDCKAIGVYGQLIIANCSNIGAGNVSISNVGAGVEVHYSNNITLFNITVERSNRGLILNRVRDAVINHLNLSECNEHVVNEIDVSNNITISNVTTTNCSALVLGTSRVDDFVLSNCMFDNVWRAVNCYRGNRYSVLDSTFNTTYDLDALEFSFSSEIEIDTIEVNCQWGMDFEYCHDFQIGNSTIHSNLTDDVYIYHSKHGSMNGCDMRRGIYIDGSGYNEYSTHSIIDCHIDGRDFFYAKNVQDMIYDGDAGQVLIVDSKNITVRDQSIFNVSNGIMILGSDEIILDNSSVYGCRYLGIWLWRSIGCVVNHSSIYNNGGHGINMSSTDDCLINSSSIYCNGNYGAVLVKADNNTFTNNEISDNAQYGLYIMSGSTNSVYYNNFDNGSRGYQAYDNGRNSEWDNGTHGNYWSDYDGTDSNGDGIGDTPYSFEGSSNATATDRYPLMEPINTSAPEKIPEFPLLPTIAFVSLVAMAVFRRRRRR